MRSPTDALEQAVDRLNRAAATGVPCAPVRDVLGADDIPSGYAVQSALIARRIERGAVRVGRKIGLTSPAVQAQLGVGQPDFGVLLNDVAIADGAAASMRRLLQPKVEAEIAFRLGADLDAEFDVHTVRAAVRSAHAAIEVVDSRIAGWDVRIADTVADNASCGLFVIAEQGFDLNAVEPRLVSMTLSVNGEVVSTGDGTACLGDPLAALTWLAHTAAHYGDPLRAGELILSGALGPMAAVQAGDQVHAELSGLGSVDVSFVEEAE